MSDSQRFDLNRLESQWHFSRKGLRHAPKSDSANSELDARQMKNRDGDFNENDALSFTSSSNSPSPDLRLVPDSSNSAASLLRRHDRHSAPISLPNLKPVPTFTPGADGGSSQQSSSASQDTFPSTPSPSSAHRSSATGRKDSTPCAAPTPTKTSVNVQSDLRFMELVAGSSASNSPCPPAADEVPSEPPSEAASLSEPLETGRSEAGSASHTPKPQSPSEAMDPSPASPHTHTHRTHSGMKHHRSDRHRSTQHLDVVTSDRYLRGGGGGVHPLEMSSERNQRPASTTAYVCGYSKDGEHVCGMRMRPLSQCSNAESLMEDKKLEVNPSPFLQQNHKNSRSLSLLSQGVSSLTMADDSTASPPSGWSGSTPTGPHSPSSTRAVGKDYQAEYFSADEDTLSGGSRDGVEGKVKKAYVPKPKEAHEEAEFSAPGLRDPAFLSSSSNESLLEMYQQACGEGQDGSSGDEAVCKKFSDTVMTNELAGKVNVCESNPSSLWQPIGATTKTRIRLIWDDPPQRVAIICRIRDPFALQSLRDIADWLVANYHMTIILENHAFTQLQAQHAAGTYVMPPNLVLANQDCPFCQRNIDFIICVGGDGTLLYVNSLFNSNVPPIISFNTGSLGFLTPFDISAFRESLTRLLQGDLFLTLRSRLHVTAFKYNEYGHLAKYQGSEMDKCLVLNDIVVDRGPSSFLVNLEVEINGIQISNIQADGVIVATTTGSTAYSLSAGGSMCHPMLPGILFTPICPHSLSTRPLVLPDSCVIKLFVAKDARASCFVSLDGSRKRLELTAGEGIAIRISTLPIPCVNIQDDVADWFYALQSLLHWNTRVVQRGFDS